MSGKEEDHDVLIRIDQNLTNLRDTFEGHLEEYERRLKKIEVEIDFLKRIVFLGIGGLVVFSTFLKLFIK